MFDAGRAASSSSSSSSLAVDNQNIVGSAWRLPPKAFFNWRKLCAQDSHNELAQVKINSHWPPTSNNCSSNSSSSSNSSFKFLTLVLSLPPDPWLNPSFSYEFLLISVSESFMAMSVKSYSGLHLSLPPGSKLFVLFSVSESNFDCNRSCSLVATRVWSTLDLLICRRFGSLNATFFFPLFVLVSLGSEIVIAIGRRSVAWERWVLSSGCFGYLFCSILKSSSTFFLLQLRNWESCFSNISMITQEQGIIKTDLGVQDWFSSGLWSHELQLNPLWDAPLRGLNWLTCAICKLHFSYCFSNPKTDCELYRNSSFGVTKEIHIVKCILQPSCKTHVL